MQKIMDKTPQTSHPLRWPLFKEKEIRKITSIGKDVVKLKPSCTVGGNVN